MKMKKIFFQLKIYTKKSNKTYNLKKKFKSQTGAGNVSSSKFIQHRRHMWTVWPFWELLRQTSRSKQAKICCAKNECMGGNESRLILIHFCRRTVRCEQSKKSHGCLKDPLCNRAAASWSTLELQLAPATSTSNSPTTRPLPLFAKERNELFF